MIRHKIIILFLLIFFSFNITLAEDNKNIIYCSPYEPVHEGGVFNGTIEDYQRQYDAIMSTTPVKELERSLTNNDYRFIGVMGWLIIPGVNDGIQNPLVKKWRFKLIVGTSDAEDSRLPPLNKVAYDFAKEYNALLIQKLE